MNCYDVILVGGGLANTLIALRLANAQPELNVLLLEQDTHLGGNHTWSFHGSDLNSIQREWLEPLIVQSWDNYEVHFPTRERRLSGTYHSINSARLDQVARARLGNSIRTNTLVTELAPRHVVLADGEILDAQTVIDGRGPHPSPHLDVRFQKFVGHVVQLETPHTQTRPIIMDATADQDDGYRFFYTLPFSADTLLIEDTRYSDTPGIEEGRYGDAIEHYAASKGWAIKSVLREESGVLPITLGGDIGSYWDESTAIPRSGLKAALFHPATGYSLPCAMRLADELAQVNDWSAENIYQHTRRASESLWEQTRFYRRLNRMLFLAADPRERRQVLERFYGLSDGLIARFYAGRSTRLDKLRILIGKPPVKLSRAYDAVFRYQSKG